MCCHEGGADGSGWPFPECRFDPLGGPDAPTALFNGLWCDGTLPWDRDRAMALSVTVSPQLTPVAFGCTGTPPSPYDLLCRGSAWQWTAGLRLEDTLWGLLDMGSGHYYFQFEVDAYAEGGPVARVCTEFCTDALRCGCPDEPWHVTCATSGQVVLSAIPVTKADLATLRFSIEATFDNGMVVSGGFSMRSGGGRRAQR